MRRVKAAHWLSVSGSKTRSRRRVLGLSSVNRCPASINVRRTQYHVSL